MSENLREYRRGLALYVLASQKQPLTAADLVEAMNTTAMNEGHPEDCWRSFDAPGAIGVLRALENARLVEQGEKAWDGRAGRETPTWRYALGPVAAQKVRLPEPPPARPARAVAAAATPEDPYAGLDRRQLYAMLEVGDMAMAELARLQAEGFASLQRSLQVNARIRLRLAEVGLGVDA
jgi:hypothetical protein